MKFFILFVLVGLGHCAELGVPNLTCATETIKDTTGLVTVILNLLCGLRGATSAEQKDTALEELNNQIKKLSDDTDCTIEELNEAIKELTGVDAVDLVDKTEDELKKIIVSLTVTKNGIANEAVEIICKVISTVLDPECLGNVVNDLKQDLGNVVDSTLKSLKCKSAEGNLDVKVVSKLLDKSGCLKISSEELEIVKDIKPVTKSLSTFVSNILKQLSPTVDKIECIAGKAVDNVKKTAKNLLGKGFFGGLGSKAGGAQGPVSAAGNAGIADLVSAEGDLTFGR